MKLSEKWLREWVNPPITTQKLQEQLTLAGLEVDSLESVAPKFEGVVVGHVLDVKQHPDADRLRVCTVDVGETEPLNIVCGAKNVREGLKVPVAKINAILPGDFKIKKSKLRGVDSFGMICSETELGLADSSEGIMELPEEAPIGMNIREYLGLEDIIIDIDLTPNRGDCLSILGVAREVAVINKMPFTTPSYHTSPETTLEKRSVSITATSGCFRYVGRIIRNVNSDAQSPFWLIEKLRRSGIRSIHPIVDITNYVLLELGQPLHAFDLDQIQGDIHVRFAENGEQIHLLDEQRLELDSQAVVIADQHKLLALAGIMGGSESAVTETTGNIFLESAFFSPSIIAKTARKYGLYTDSSQRFERGVDPELQKQAIERASELLLNIVGGELGPIVEVSHHLAMKTPILLRKERISRVLGIQISDEEVVDILKRLGMQVTSASEGWKIVAPSYRFDINLEIDLIEELARIHGYSNIPPRKIVSELHFVPQTETKLNLFNVRTFLANRGYQEAITYSFVDPKYEEILALQKQPLRLLNPISSELSVMRTNHWAGLIEIYKYNSARQQPRVRLFEIGLCFLNEESTLKQQLRLGGLCSGTQFPEQWGEPSRQADFFDIKGDIENLLKFTHQERKIKFKPASHPALHPGKSAEIVLEDRTIGFCGALHPSIQQELDINQILYLFDLNLESIISILLPVYETISKFPAIRRDIALVVNADVPADRVKQKILDSGGELLKNVQIFDLYQGKGIELGKKSIGFGLTFQHFSRTLVDAEINGLMQTIIDGLHNEFNATLRD